MAADLADLFQNLAKSLFDPYRPELHYMRGPGPKWHAKHDPAPAALDAMPASFGSASRADRPALIACTTSRSRGRLQSRCRDRASMRLAVPIAACGDLRVL